MQGYLLQILTVSFLCGLVEMLVPLGEREGLRRAVRLVAALCLLTGMLAPLREVSGRLSMPDLGAWARGWEAEAEADYEELMREKLTAVGEGELRPAIHALLRSRFGIAPEDCEVSFSWEAGESLAVSHVWIAVRGQAVMVDPRAIEAAIGEAVGCGCTVSVGGRSEK